MIFWQLLINAIIAGSFNALVASGFSLIYSTNRFVHLAHGAIVAVGAYFLYTLTATLGWPFGISIMLTLAGTGLIGVGVYYTIYLPLRRRKSSRTILLIASIALMFLLENILLLVFGAGVKAIPAVPAEQGLVIGSASITPFQIIIILVAVSIFVLLFLFMRYARFGKIMRAVADNPELAELTGIPTSRVNAFSFFIGSALAAVAGIAIGIEYGLSPHIGTNWAVRGFSASIIGGIASVPGAVLGGYLLGLVENFGIWYLPSAFKEGVTFGLLILFLLFRPNGIWGISKGTRE